MCCLLNYESLITELMELKIRKNSYNVLRSYFPPEGQNSFEFPVLLHGTKIALRASFYPSVWYVGFIKVDPISLSVHFISEEDLQYKETNPDFYQRLWYINQLKNFGTLVELHILKQEEEILL